MADIESHKLIIADRRLNILFLQRWLGAGFNGGGIDFPGGKPKARDSSPLETAIRETGEEIGLWLKPSQCGPRPLIEREYQDAGNEFRKTAWLAIVDELPRQINFLPSREHIGSIALHRDPALNLVRQPFQVDALRQLSA